MDRKLYLKIFVKSNRKELRFFLFFILLFISVQAIHYVVYPFTVPLFVHKLNAEASSMIINLITPEEKSFVEDRTIRSGSFKVKVIGGCEGTEGMLLLVAAIWAFNMSIGKNIKRAPVRKLKLYISMYILE